MGVVDIHSKPQSYPFDRASDMLALKPPEPVIDDLLFENTNNVLFGASNAFKSFIGVDVGCHVANGRDWHGKRTTKGPVIYVAGEGGYGIRALRIPGWHQHYGIQFTNRANIVVVSVDVLLDVSEEYATERLFGTGVEAFGAPAKLYVFDVLKRVMRGSESDDTAVAAVIAAQQGLLAMQSGAALLTLTHTGWADQTRSRGHTDLWGSFDTRLKAEGDKDQQTTLLTVDRHKDAEGGQSWGFKLEKTEPLINAKASAQNTTLVPVLDETLTGPSTAKKRKKGPKEGGPQWAALGALREAIAASGELPPASNHIPPNVKAVPRGTWDTFAEHRFQAMYEANVRASRMNGAITGLLGKYVGHWNEWCWPHE